MLMVVTRDVHRICDITVVHLFKCIFNLGPRAVIMLRAPRNLNPALIELSLLARKLQVLPNAWNLIRANI